MNLNSLESVLKPLGVGNIGAEITVRNNGRIIWQRSTESVQEHPRRRFPIYSLTKSYIAALIFRLCEKEKIDLDDTISTRISYSVPKWAQDITIRHLLSHRGGIGDYGGMTFYKEALLKAPSNPPSKEEIYSSV